MKRGLLLVISIILASVFGMAHVSASPNAQCEGKVPSIGVDASSYPQGNAITYSWNYACGFDSESWVGLFESSASDATAFDSRSCGCASYISGTGYFSVNFNLAPRGDYELRLFSSKNGGHVAISPTFSIYCGGPYCSSTSVEWNPICVNCYQKVYWSVSPYGQSGDVLVLQNSGGASWCYTGGGSSGYVYCWVPNPGFTQQTMVCFYDGTYGRNDGCTWFDAQGY